jgi:hypothetical protein
MRYKRSRTEQSETSHRRTFTITFYKLYIFLIHVIYLSFIIVHHSSFQFMEFQKQQSDDLMVGLLPQFSLVFGTHTEIPSSTCSWKRDINYLSMTVPSRSASNTDITFNIAFGPQMYASGCLMKTFGQRSHQFSLLHHSVQFIVVLELSCATHGDCQF